MNARPVIFISAVSRELRSARQLVANTLTFLGYEPEWQDIFGAEQGDLRGMLRRRVDASAGVVQIVGRCHGAEPPEEDAQFGRVSYTQFEALYARQRGKKVWYLFLDDGFPADPHDPEPEELTALQTAYRERLRTGDHLFHPLGDTRDVENTVLKLRDDLAHLRRRGRQWAAALLILIGLCAGGILWSMKRGGDTQQAVSHVERKVDALPQALAEAIQRNAEGIGRDEAKDDTTRRALLLADLEKKYGIKAGTLAAELPEFARRRAEDAAIPTMERAKAAYAALDYKEAERLALEAHAAAKKSLPLDKHKVIEALNLAGNSASERGDYLAAMARLTEASKLTDKASDPLEWARVHYALACALVNHRDVVQAASLLQEVVSIQSRMLGAEHPETLTGRNWFANALRGEGKYAEAAREHRAVFEIRQRVLGVEHPDTLRSWHNVAALLGDQGKTAEAEASELQLIGIELRALGGEHPLTLKTRSNLALSWLMQGRHAQAEAEHRAVLAIQQRVLGAEHPETLMSRQNLAMALYFQKQYAAAESENRAVFDIRQRVLGMEHPDTLHSRMLIANLLDDQSKHAGAEAEHRAVLASLIRVVGSEDSRVADSCFYLALCLHVQGKKQEGLDYIRRALAGYQRSLGNEHPSTKNCQKMLALFPGG